MSAFKVIPEIIGWHSSRSRWARASRSMDSTMLPRMHMWPALFEQLLKCYISGLVQRCCNRPSKIYDGVCRQCKKINCRKHTREVFSVNTLKQRLPILKWLPKYRFASCAPSVFVYICAYAAVPLHDGPVTPFNKFL